jgi:hypothetical protein
MISLFFTMPTGYGHGAGILFSLPHHVLSMTNDFTEIASADKPPVSGMKVLCQKTDGLRFSVSVRGP